MIIIGYPGIGKSSISSPLNNCIDLESGNFWIKTDDARHNIRDKEWYIPYCNIAEDLSRQGYTVFVASHSQVRKQLENSNEDVCIICPALELKWKWIDRLATRYSDSRLDKDYKAYERCIDCFDIDINDLLGNGRFPVHLIESTEYDLWDIVKKL